MRQLLALALAVGPWSHAGDDDWFSRTALALGFALMGASVTVTPCDASISRAVTGYLLSG